jgi:hypothetical protein
MMTSEKNGCTLCILCLLQARTNKIKRDGEYDIVEYDVEFKIK